MDPPAGSPRAPIPRPTAWDYACIAFALAVLVFAPMVALEFASDGVTPYEHTGWALRALLTVPAIVPCALVLWPPVWLVCHRRRAVMPLVAMFAVLYTPIAAFQLVGYVNVAFDDDPGRRVLVRYVRWERGGKGPSHYVFTSWRDPNDTIALQTTRLTSTSYPPGTPVSLVVHPGRLGLEWVSDVREAR